MGVRYGNSGGGGSGVPFGTIAMWHGSIATIPAGWHFCDGTGGTPDLRNLMIAGAVRDTAGTARTDIDPGVTNVQSGGSGIHHHPINCAVATNTFGGVSGGDFNAVTDASTILSDPQDAFPVPYYALAFMMKL